MPGQQQSANGDQAGINLKRRLENIFHHCVQESKGNEAEPMESEARFVKAVSHAFLFCGSGLGVAHCGFCQLCWMHRFSSLCYLVFGASVDSRPPVLPSLELQSSFLLFVFFWRLASPLRSFHTSSPQALHVAHMHMLLFSFDAQIFVFVLVLFWVCPWIQGRPCSPAWSCNLSSCC